MNTSRQIKRVWKCLLATVVGMMAGTPAKADTHTWTNKTIGVQDWTVVGSWNGGVYVSDPANDLVLLDNVEPPSAGTQTITNAPSTLSMKTLTLNGNAINNPIGYTIKFAGDTPTWTIGDGTTSTINLNADRHSFDVRTTYHHVPHIVLNNSVTTITGNGSGAGFYFKGNISEAAAGYGITKSGTSRAFFFGTNTYTGPTTINGGLLRLSSANALPGGTGASGGTSALTLSGGVLELAAGDFLRNLGMGSSQFQITGGISGFSAKGAPRGVVVNNDETQELAWGSGTFQPTVLVLNTITETTAPDRCDNDLTLVNKIDLNGATRTVDVGAYAAILLGDIRTSSATAGLTKTGVGTLVLSGANSYNGTTTISGGTLSMGAADNLGSGSAGLVFNDGTLKISGTTLTSLSGLGHSVTFTATKSVGFDIAHAANTFTVDQVLNQTTGGFIKRGAGTLVLSQANTYTGATTLSGGGNLVLDYTTQDNAKISTGALTLSGSALTLSGGSHTQTVSSTSIPVNAGNFITRSSGSAVINLNAITRGGNRSSLSFPEEGIATTDTINGATKGILGGWVTVGSHLAVNSTGAADGLIAAYSAYTTFITSGGSYDSNYQLIGSSNLTAATINGTLRVENDANDQVLNLQNYTLTLENYNAANGGVLLYAGGANNNYTITGGGNIVCRNPSGQALGFNIYKGILTLDVPLGVGGSDFVKTGAGTLVMNKARTQHTGATYLQQGVTRITHGDALGSSKITVQSGTVLELVNSITVSATSLTISGSGIANGGALRNVSGDNTFGGAIVIEASGVRVNSDSGTLTLSGNITAADARDITFGGAGNITISSALVNGCGVIKDGAGTLGIVVNDNRATRWNCGDMTLNNSTLAFTFNVTPSATEPIAKVVGDLTFSGTPTISISDPGEVAVDGLYPLLTVAGTVPATLPTLTGVSGQLKWGGAGNKTLFWDTRSATGTIMYIR